MRIYATSCSVVLTLAAASRTSSAFQPARLAQRTTTSSTSRTSTTSKLDASQCGNYDFDVAIVGCGVGGHGAALHARAQQLETAVFAGGDVGGSEWPCLFVCLYVCMFVD